MLPGRTSGEGVPTARQGLPVRTTLGAPNPRYAVPSGGENDPYNHDSPVGAWAPPLYSVPGSTPDPHRLNTMQQYDYRVDPRESPEEYYAGPYNPGSVDRQARHRVEYLDADGRQMPPMPSHNVSPNPRSLRIENSRPTQSMSPATYVFTRPFDQHAERQFNGVHFSMADHRRQYPILGMTTPGTRRNTYRKDPEPWDVNLVDMPNPNTAPRPGQIVAYDLPPQGGNRGYRL